MAKRRTQDEAHGYSERPKAGHAPQEAVEATEEALRAERKPGRIKVRVKDNAPIILYGHKRRRPGDVFTISGERNPADMVYGGYAAGVPKALRGTKHPRAGELKELSQWMEILPADDRTPERTTTMTQAAQRSREELRGGLVPPDAARAADVDQDDDVLG